MSFIRSLKGRFRSGDCPPRYTADDNMNASEAARDAEVAGKSHELRDRDSDGKGDGTEPVESGVGTIEAAQAIWGKKGRWLVITG